MANLEGSAKRLMAYIGEADTYDSKPLYEALVEASRTAGCAGATVLRGIEGFGATSREWGKRAMRMSEDRPVVVVVVDSEDRISAVAELFATMMGDGLITLEDVQVTYYRGGVTGGPTKSTLR